MPFLYLGRDGERKFQIDADLVVTGRTCVLGTSGSGKSYTVAVICEELCKNQVPFLLVDTEGEYSGLKEKYEVIWVGDDRRCDLTWDGLDLSILAQHAPDIVPLILDLSETDDSKGKVDVLLSRLYSEVSKRRTPYLVILEEADRFIPQVGDRLKIFEEVARRGRKRGLGLMLCTQRPSSVDKNILSQCSNQLIGKLVIKNDLQAVAQFFPGRGLPKELTALYPGAFYALGGLSQIPVRVNVRPRDTRHEGITPKLMKRVIKPSSKVLSEIRSSRLEVKQFGIPPLISANDIPPILKRVRSSFLFGKREIVKEVTLTWRPLVELGVRIRTGWLRKRFETRFLIVDRVTGQLVELGNSLVFQEGLKRFLGLHTQHIEILRALDPEKDSSLIEIAGEIRVPERVLRKSMNFLEEKRLVRASKIGRVKVFRRLVDPPKIQLSGKVVKIEKVAILDEKVDKVRVEETEIREIIRGLFEGSDLESFRPFLYPLYRVEMVSKRKTKVIWIDGRMGRKVTL